jgi:hypothetical protein
MSINQNDQSQVNEDESILPTSAPEVEDYDYDDEDEEDYEDEEEEYGRKVDPTTESVIHYLDYNAIVNVSEEGATTWKELYKTFINRPPFFPLDAKEVQRLNFYNNGRILTGDEPVQAGMVVSASLGQDRKGV